MRHPAPPQGAQAALRAIRLLKLFTAEAPELQLADISARSGLNKTTTHRLLQALSSNDLRLRARPLLRRLADETGETATLEVPIDDSMLILDEVTSKHVVGASGNVGTRWPIHATSTGKAFIAFDMDGTQRLRGKLASLTPKTITQLDVLEKQLSDIRRRGFAETVDELEDGFSGVGAVVRDGMGEVLGALSICGPSQRMSGARRAQLGASLCVAASQLQPRY
jgi:DNA-binding IclR family transcriptional regulator